MGKLCISISISIMVSVICEIYHNGVVKILCITLRGRIKGKSRDTNLMYP